MPPKLKSYDYKPRKATEAQGPCPDLTSFCIKAFRATAMLTRVLAICNQGFGRSRKSFILGGLINGLGSPSGGQAGGPGDERHAGGDILVRPQMP